MKEIRKRITAWLFMIAISFIGFLLACEVLLHGDGLVSILTMPFFFLGCFILLILVVIESVIKKLRLPEKLTENKLYKRVFNIWFSFSLVVFIVAFIWFSMIGSVLLESIT